MWNYDEAMQGAPIAIEPSQPYGLLQTFQAVYDCEMEATNLAAALDGSRPDPNGKKQTSFCRAPAIWMVCALGTAEKNWRR